MPYYLDKPKQDKPTAIFLKLSLPEGRFVYPVKEKVHPSDWINERTKDRTVNTILNRIEVAVEEFISDHKRLNKPISAKELKDELDSLLNRKTRASGFFGAIDSIIDDREIGRATTGKGKIFSAETIKGYRHSRDLLFRYNPKLNFNDITPQFYDKLISYFNSKNYSINSIGKVIKNLRVFMDAAHEAGYHSNMSYRKFKVPDEKTPDIYLTIEELDRIYNLKDLNDRLDLARDWFIIDCFTGLRIADIKLLSNSNLNGDTIKIVNEKTDIVVAIPVHKYVRQILEKWGGFPRKISDQKLNQYIKEVAQLAEINQPFLYSVTKGGIRRDEYYQKWEMVSNHTARRSFITNLLKAGLNHNEVMKLAGLKKMTTLQRYYKESEDEVADRLKSHPFFT
ncbi:MULTISPECIES: tyrosine-type recombinase/integrase [unclassified Paraflavitalea]|uniref:tyrosine-type recombinase/integrase n=1 Tax=unclassified Paraflavitalea TaxID=2798305 RepID=UPI003D349C86